MGFSTVALADHFTGGYTVEPFVMLTAAAMESTRLRVQTAVLGNDYRHPVLTHRMAATLDVISEGRLERNSRRLERRTISPPVSTTTRPVCASSASRESITVLKGLFSGAAFTFTGNHFRVRDPRRGACIGAATASSAADRRGWSTHAAPGRSRGRHRRTQRQPRGRGHRWPFRGRRGVGADGREGRLGPGGCRRCRAGLRGSRAVDGSMAAPRHGGPQRVGCADRQDGVPVGRRAGMAR